MKALRHSLLILVLALFTGLNAMAQYGAEPEPLEDYQVESYWERFAEACAERYVKFGDHYYACAHYRRGTSVSHPLNPIAKDMLKRSFSIGYELNDTFRRSLSRDYSIRRPPEELEAAREVLPDLLVDEYGQVHSAHVTNIVGEYEMIVKDLWLIDAQAFQQDWKDAERELKKWADDEINDIKQLARRIPKPKRGKPPRAVIEVPSNNDLIALRQEMVEWQFQYRRELFERQNQFKNREIVIKGISTRSLFQNSRWQADRGQALAIVAIENNRFVAIPLAAFREGLSLDQFEAMLGTREIDRRKFAEIARDVDENRMPGQPEEPMIIRRIERR